MGDLVRFGDRRGNTRITIDPELLSIEFEDRCVKCNETGKVYKDARAAADWNGINWVRMKKHLDGKLDGLRCPPYAKLTFSYTDDQLDEYGRVINDRVEEDDDE